MNATTYPTALDAVRAQNALTYAAELGRRQTPRRRTYLKEVTVDAANYANTHNREPKGYGTWVFLPAHADRDQTPTGEPLRPEEAQAQRYALAIQIRGTYKAARHEAAKIAASQGQTHLVTAP